MVQWHCALLIRHLFWLDHRQSSVDHSLCPLPVSVIFSFFYFSVSLLLKLPVFYIYWPCWRPHFVLFYLIGMLISFAHCHLASLSLPLLLPFFLCFSVCVTMQIEYSSFPLLTRRCSFPLLPLLVDYQCQQWNEAFSALVLQPEVYVYACLLSFSPVQPVSQSVPSPSSVVIYFT